MKPRLPKNFTLLDLIYEKKDHSLARVKNTDDENVYLLKFVNNEDSVLAGSKLQHETAVIKKIKSSAIPELASFNQDKQNPHLIFEDINGIVLRDAIETATIDTTSFLRSAIRFASALEDMHHHQIIHNHLNPDDIFINIRHDQLKIMDFQHATFLSVENADNFIQTGFESSLKYISPEQTGRMNRSIDYRSDYYSFGIILYEILTGHAPFESSDPLEMVHSHIALMPASPSMLNPGIPDVISDIVMKLISKNAEDRYQSINGIKSDLEECLLQWTKNKSVDRFEIAQNDHFDVLSIPEKLYGRDKEIDQLKDVFEGIAQGHTSFITISGYSGIGKTTLVREIYKPLTKSRGYFVSGKFDQLNRNIPYLSLIEALRDLIKLVLTESEAQLKTWQKKIKDGLGTNARIIADVVPELEIVTGKLKPVQKLPPAEAQIRFNNVFKDFISIFARRKHPLVIFLDDVQWADPASLSFLDKLLVESRHSALLVICAYRDNEVDEHHPLERILGELRKKKFVDSEIKLNILTSDSVDQLLSDTLHLPGEQLKTFSELIYDKTQGNPFFIKQFLKTLVDNKLLQYNSDKNTGPQRWTWDISEIQKLAITENVVQLLMNKLESLPEEAKTILQLAACIGNEFDLKTLSLISEITLNHTAQYLWYPLQQGLIIPDSENYKYVLGGPEVDSIDLSINYRFLHDRVQQAAFALIPDNKKEEIHYRIGILLLENTPDEAIDNHIFDILYHLNRSVSLFIQNNDKYKLAQLNLSAGKRAKNSAAFEAAFEYFNTGVQLLNKEDRQDQYKLCWTLYNELSEAEYIIGRFDDAEQHFEEVYSFSKTNVEKAKILTTKVKLYTHIDKVQEALETGIQAAQLLHWPLAPNPGKIKVGLEFLKTRIKLSLKSISALQQLPEMQNEFARAAVDLLSHMTTAAYFTGPEMIGYLNLKMMQIVIKYGNPESAPFVYSQYALLEGAGAGAYQKAFQLGELALSLTQTHKFPYWKSRTYLTMGAIINHWRKPMETNLPILKEAYHSAIESGDLLYAIYANRFVIHTKISMGTDLNDLLTEVNQYKDFASKTRHNSFDLTIYHRMIVELTGDKSKSNSDSFEDGSLLNQIREAKDLSAEIQYYICRLKTSFFNQDYSEAVKIANDAKHVRHGSFGQLLELEYRFFSALAMAKMYKKSGSNVQREMKSLFRKQHAKISKWAANCPENFKPHLKLIEAEWLRMRDDATAGSFYREALKTALESGLIHIAAITCECAADFFISQDHNPAAIAYAADSIYYYQQWGATNKSNQLRKQYDELFQDFRPKVQSILKSGNQQEASISSSLDVNTIIRSSQTISGEIQLDKLIEKIMQIVIANAGAQNGLLLLEEDGNLFVEARVDAAAESGIKLVKKIPLSEFGSLAHSVVRYVQRSKESLVLNDARKDDRFMDDPHISGEQVHSILCLPILNQLELKGVLYLENNLTTSAFSDERIELLNVLTNEMAISIENARLYEQLKSANIKLEEYSRSLEKKVKERTKDLQKRSVELSKSNKDLEQTMQSLKNTQEQLIQSEKMASLGELTAGIAHEIKNPLNFVNNFAESSVDLLTDLKDNIGKVKENFEDDLEEDTSLLLSDIEMNLAKIAEHGKRADAIIHSMMLHARGSDGQKEAADINDMLEESINLVYHGMRAQNPDFNITINKNFDKAVGKLEVFSQDMNRVFLNLINNGCYAAYQHSSVNKNINPELSVTSVNHPDKVEIRVRDNGAGIEADQKDKIFNPFFTTKPAGKGTGLGLSISYDIISKKHNGTISLTSEQDKFTEFIITLPK